ncbi:protein adenylyltransferase SelO [Mycobacterium sp. smrl_JER01]|uniref:protein adenylyltransferase SelO n=1 Tax=Mycobacterium sp. smrl_JER01 TaxID=3402633 RepID=UPI003AC5967E
MTVALQSRFVGELPELAVSWKAEDAPQPELLAFNEPLAVELGLDPDWLRGPDGLALLVGVAVPPTATPAAQAYAGHQFGGYQPRLGDGRALLIGELVDTTGGLRDLHLKGSGRTPFARGGDGLAAVGPMLREYVISEAMHALGIPTTRALAVVGTGRVVYRETALPGAVLARVAASHLRVGTFQYAASLAARAGSASGQADTDVLRRLADHAIARHHPQAAEAEHPYLALLDAVSAAQARLVATWMLVGFIHGVMNTDNMTISGETIDYGPCAFMEAFDPATVFSSIDSWGRYAYGNQPSIALWNLARFAETLLPLLDEDTGTAIGMAETSLGAFQGSYEAAWTEGMGAKLGVPNAPNAAIATLAEQLLSQLAQSGVDHTSFYRRLAVAARGDAEPVRGEFIDLAAFDDWLARWRALGPDPDLMDRTNPLYIPRNHLVEEALSAATGGDLAPVQGLLAAIGSPFDERPGLQRYSQPAEKEFSASFQTFCGT